MVLYAEAIIVLLASAALSIAVAAWTWATRRGPGARAFAGSLAAFGLWGVGVAFQVTSPTVAGQEWWILVTAPVVWAAAPLWFVATVHLAGREALLTRPVKAALVGFYAISVGLVLTNPVHGLLWRGYVIVETDPLLIDPSFEPLYLALIVIVYALIFLGLLLLVDVFRRSHRGRRHAIAVGTAATIPVLLHMLAVTGLVDVGVQLTPSVAGISGAIVAVSLFRDRLFDVIPVAWDVVMGDLEEAVIVIDRDEALVDANPAAVRQFPRLQHERGRPLAELLPELYGLVAAGGSWPGAEDQEDGHDFVHDAGGRTRYYDVTVSLIEHDRRPRGRAVILHDVTARHEHRERLARQADQLEEVASSIAHDIRNPLSVAEGYIELSKETGDPEDLEHAAGALDRLGEIVEDVMTLARAGATIADPEPVSLADVAWAAWAVVDSQSATLIVEVPRETTVAADQTRLRSVFENLFRNAVQHGGDDVTIRVGTPADAVGFVVSDDGPGVPPEARDHLFDRGYTTLADGAGLGLALVRAVADAHGWEIDVDAAESGGARFTFLTAAPEA